MEIYFIVMLDLCTKYYDTFIFNMYGNSIMTCTFIIKQSVWPCVCFIEVQVHAKPRARCLFHWDNLPDTYRGWVIFTFWGWVILIKCIPHCSTSSCQTQISLSILLRPFTRYLQGLGDFQLLWQVNINFLGLGDIDKCMPHWGTSSCQTQDKVSILLRQFTRYLQGLGDFQLLWQGEYQLSGAGWYW